MLRRIVSLVRRPKLDRELDDEVRFHLESLEAEFRVQGLAPHDARLAARREFGGIDSMKETYRDRRGVRWLEDFMRDLRHGARCLRRNPGFAAVAILSLALGIGLNAAVFAIFHALLLRMLPVARPEDLVSLYRHGGWGEGFMSYPLYTDLRDQTDVFDGVLARSGVMRRRLGADGSAVQFIESEYVSGNYFSVLRIKPAAGRLLAPDDARARGQNPVAVLSYDAWRSRFALDPAIIGRTLVIGWKQLTVVGIAAPGFTGVEVERKAEVWIPLTMGDTDISTPGAHWLWTLGRRKPGVADSKIQAEANTVISRYLTHYYGNHPEPGFKRMAMDQRIEVRPGGIGISLMRAEFERPLRILMGAVILVLLVACANVASLLLARGAARRREMALRLSIGASRWRLVRQWLTESALIASIGGAAGLIAGAWAARSAATLLPGEMEGDSLPVHLAGGVLLFVVAVAVGSALFFGLISGLGATAVETAPARQSAIRLRAGMRKTLVAGQVAMSVVLVATAGLLARSLAGLRSLDLGFHNYGVLTFYIYAPRTYQAQDYQRLYDRFFARVSALPGVDSASAGFPGPYQGGSYSGTIFVPGAETKSREHEIARQSVYQRYFETIGARPVGGRDFDAHDFVRTAKTAIVNQAFAREFFGAGDPVGKMISFNDSGPADVTIVGMVKDMQHDGIRTTAQPVVYVPAAGDENRSASVILVNARLRPGDLTRIIRRELAAIDPSVAMEEPRTLRERIDRSIFQDRMLAGLSIAFSVLALLLAGIGIYGVMAFVVARRTAEIGVRMALGARPSGVLWMTMREGLAMVAAGVAIGIPAALAAARLTRNLLFGVHPGDPATAVVTILVVFAVGALASSLPARRAATVDPIEALRSE
jgi:predicted permease